MRKMFLAFFAVLFAMQSGVFAARSTVAKQDAFNSGTKINESGVNSLVDAECSDSYFGCMDAFCIVDNVSGGRCQCSNKHIDLSNNVKLLFPSKIKFASFSGASIYSNE